MPIIKVEDENGVEIEAIKKEEYEAEVATAVAVEKAKLEAEFQGKLAEKDAFVKEKLDEFLKGKTSTELKEKEWETKLEEARKVGQSAVDQVNEEKQKRTDATKDYIMQQYIGTDPELKKKLDEAYGMVNKEVKTDDDIKERVRLAANMAGLSGGTKMVDAPMFGGYAPTFTPTDTTKKDQDYENFKGALGLGDILPGKKQE